MKVIERLSNSKNPLFSYEIVPPNRGGSVQDIIDMVSVLTKFDPPWIDVTSHSAGAFFQERKDGTIERKIYKKRPGTLGICGIIQNRFKIDAVAHILCNGFTREETEDALIELNYLGVHNVLALRGDGLNYNKYISEEKTINTYASDLVDQIAQLREGKLLNEITHRAPLDFCVGVAGYPEGHFAGKGIASDIEYLKNKIENGAQYIVTQMFYDNRYYFDFVDSCRKAGINVPIIAGLKIINSIKQLETLTKKFHIKMPHSLVEGILSDPTHVKEIGIEWATKQTMDLLEKDTQCVHYYIMNDISSVTRVVEKFYKHT